mmetsp:Transcript_101301/g.291826  ORF Transcript_101301/g.291826 Transcript_101301/m.291826 type:complete len:230 (-) Transcript_101301:1638-2327(-)
MDKSSHNSALRASSLFMHANPTSSNVLASWASAGAARAASWARSASSSSTARATRTEPSRMPRRRSAKHACSRAQLSCCPSSSATRAMLPAKWASRAPSSEQCRSASESSSFTPRSISSSSSRRNLSPSALVCASQRSSKSALRSISAASALVRNCSSKRSASSRHSAAERPRASARSSASRRNAHRVSAAPLSGIGDGATTVLAASLSKASPAASAAAPAPCFLSQRR